MGNSSIKPIVYAVSTNNLDKKDNETHVYRNPAALGKDIFCCESVQTLQEVMNHRFKQSDAPYLGSRLVNAHTQQRDDFFTWKTGYEVKSSATHFGSGLLAADMVPARSDFKHYELRMLGFYSRNTVEYFIADIACIFYGITSVPIYDTLGEEAALFAFNQTKMATCIVLSAQLQVVISLKRAGKLPFLRNVILPDQRAVDAELRAQAGDELALHTFEEVLARGAASPQPHARVGPDSIHTISYTSGTTGEPKGVMISHRNIACMIPSIGKSLSAYLGPDGRYLSYLPMAHILERAVFYVTTFFGLHVGVFSGDVNRISEDAVVLKPTLFVSVPRVYVKMYYGILKQVKEQSWAREAVFNHALGRKLENLRARRYLAHALYDRVVFAKIRQRFGGEVRMMICGSAAIKSDVLDFLRVAFSTRILEGYGQTEGCGVQFLCDAEDLEGCGVGGPQMHLEFKLVDVPELGYLSTDRNAEGHPTPRGEVWVRGPNVVPGYYLNEEKFRETCTADGWLRSGDIGMLEHPSLGLKIVDRKKNIFKLSQGEYIAPEKLENVYRTATPYVTDLFVYGDAYREKIVAVVVMEPEDLLKFAALKGIDVGEGEAARESPRLKKSLLDAFYACGKENKLNSLEMIKAVHVARSNFIDLGLKTVTFKLKRHEAKAKFAAEIEKLYLE